MKNFKKMGALLGLSGAIAGLSGGVIAANANAASAPVYHWYKVSDPDAANRGSVAVHKAKVAGNVNNKEILLTHTTIMHDNLKPTSDVLYYRATYPIAGGSIADNNVAYNEWKMYPDEHRVITVWDSKSNPSLNKYTYNIMVVNYDSKSVVLHTTYTNVPKWVD